MGLSLRNGDYVPDGTGGLRRTEGREALLEQVLFRLTARRGSFPFLPELGSRLWQLGQLPAVQRQSAAEQYVAEALAAESASLFIEDPERSERHENRQDLEKKCRRLAAVRSVPDDSCLQQCRQQRRH